MYSVVVPTTSNEPFISAALDSIAAQGLLPDRVVVVVNGEGAVGSDLGREVREHRIGAEVIETPVPGVARAMAMAVDALRTPFVAFLDADDLWSEDKQRAQLSLLKERPHVDAVVGRTANFRERPDGSRHLEAHRGGRLFGATTFRRAAFVKYGTPDASAEHFTWLYRWWSQAQAAGIVTAVDDRLVLLRRIHALNGWVTGRDAGRRQLLSELRRLNRLREAAT